MGREVDTFVNLALMDPAFLSIAGGGRE